MDSGKIKKVLHEAAKDSSARFSYLSKLGLYDWMPDAQYLKLKYKSVFGRELNLEKPKTYNEKLQWLKLNDRKPEYTRMVDKYLVRQYVAEVIGAEYLIPLLGVWDNPDKIDFDQLPDQFVLKCNHNSGLGMCICKDKSRLNLTETRAALQKGLKENYYIRHREWPYKDVPRKIIAEKYMSDGENEELNDYKLMCFNGTVKMSFVCSNRFNSEGLNVTFYDEKWNRLPFERHYPASATEIEKPVSYEEMVRLAEQLAQNIPFVRVDFYEIEGKPYFGEMTFFPGSGFEEFEPMEWDYKIGEMLELPKIN